MAIKKMKLIQISCDIDSIEDMLHGCLRSKLFHAEEALDVIQKDSNDKIVEVDNPYEDYANRIKNIAHNIGFELKDGEPTKIYTKEECQAKTMMYEDKFSFANESNLSLTKDDEIALNALRDLDYKRLHECKFVHFGLGRIPQNNVKKINLVDHSKLMIATLHENSHYRWICYATSNTFLKEVTKSLEKLYFEEMKIPVLDSKKMTKECGLELTDVYNFCCDKSVSSNLYRFLIKRDERYNIVGFIVSDKLNKFKEYFDNNFEIEELDINDYDNLKIPTVLKNNWFFKPFELFIDMYSLPKYKELDPTWILGLTYCVLFGIMFGDLGQGLIFFIGGLIIELKSKNKLAGIIARIGVFSMISGFIYGSVFGNEEILIPVHQALFNTSDKLIHVMSSSVTMNLLMASVVVGSFLIIMSIMLNVLTNLKRKNYGEVLFSHNGIAGLIFYMYFALALFLMVSGSTLNLFNFKYMVFFGIIPVFLFFMKEPLSQFIDGNGIVPQVGWGNYALEAVFEVVEILFSYVTNSLSYLRVGGFILSHAGMMLVVMTLMDMTGNAGIFVLVFGNIFVMIIEGLIVGIQTLRLEYYEMFSRYFEGGGKSFELISTENKIGG
ncbi:MAG: V-type ATP synthase subunit I [Anaerorhabdus sp.]